MIRKAIIAIGAAALLLPMVFFGAAAVRIWLHPHPDVAKLSTQPPRLEMMAPETFEWTEQHFPSKDGNDERTMVTFRNGSIGWRFFRPNHTLERITVTRKDGVQLVDLWYSPEGKQIVSGYERRHDGTMRREARTTDGVVTMRTYWQDGKTLFSLTHRKVDDFHFEGTFFYATGVKWATQYGTVLGATFEQTLWNEKGELVSHFVKDDIEHGASAQLFRPNGVVRVAQFFAKYKYEIESEHGVGYGYRRGLHHVDIFDENASLAWRIVMDDTGQVMSRFERYATIGGATVKVDDIVFDHERPAPIEMHADFTSADSLNPARPDWSWTEEEKKVSVTTETK